MAELTEPAMREVLKETMAALTRLNELWGLDDPGGPSSAWQSTCSADAHGRDAGRPSAVVCSTLAHP